MVWNPTAATISTTLAAPLYYAGISKSVGDATVMLSHEGRAAVAVPLGANDTLGLNISLGPRELTWFVVS
jgi:hypothetical protein